MQRPKHTGFAILILVAITGAFYPTFSNEFVSWDDYENFVNNPYYRGLTLEHLKWMFTTFHMGPYQPLSWVSLAVDYLVWGLDPFGYHLTNLLLHALNALLLYGFITAFLKRLDSSRTCTTWGFEAAVAAAVLFYAVHPLRVESVAWATERRDVLSGLFFILTLWGYLKFTGCDDSRSQLKWYGFCLLAFAASLISKAAGMTLPVVLLILDIYPLRRLSRENLWVRLLEKGPFLGLSVAAGLVALTGQQQAHAMEFVSDHGLVDRCMQAAYGLCFYLWKTLIPVRLSPLYLMEQPFDPLKPVYLICLIAVIGISLVLFLRRRTWPWALATWLSYAILVSPVLGFAQSGWQIAADRYTYLPAIPLSILLAAILVSGHRRSWIRSAMICIIPLMILQTHLQTRIWHGGLSLWNHALTLNPDHWFALNNRAKLLQDLGDVRGAMEDFDRAIALNPDYATARYNRGVLRSNTEDIPGALEDLNAAIEKNPDFSEAWNNRGTLKEAMGDMVGAEGDYGKAIEAGPTNIAALYNRGNLRHRAGNILGALQDFDTAVALKPPLAALYNNRGYLKQQRGDWQGALEDYDEAIQLDPLTTELPYVNRANILMEQGRYEEAVRDLRMALQIAPLDWPFRELTEQRIRSAQF